MENSFENVIKPSKTQELMIIKHRYLLKIILFLGIYFFSVATILYIKNSNCFLEVLLCVPFYLVAGASLNI